MRSVAEIYILSIVKETSRVESMYSNDDFPASDQSVTIAQLKQWVDAFADQRNWAKYHSAKNLSMSIAIEAAELMEHFQWRSGGTESPDRVEPAEGDGWYSGELDRHAVGEEMADVLSYLLRMSSVLGVDLASALQAKMAKNAMKYPAP